MKVKVFCLYVSISGLKCKHFTFYVYFMLLLYLCQPVASVAHDVQKLMRHQSVRVHLLKQIAFLSENDLINTLLSTSADERRLV